MTKHVVLCGLGVAGATLVRGLSVAGMEVFVCEADAATSERIGNLLRRQFGDVTFSVGTTEQSVNDVIFIGDVDAARQFPNAGLFILTGGLASLALAPDPRRTVAADILDPRFAELSYGTADEEVRREADAFLARLGARVLITSSGDSFVGTLLLDTALAMADRLLLAGATPWELDAGLEAAGFARGLLAEQDRIGLDVAFARRRAADVTLLIADRMVHEGRLGRSVGVGWYRYPGGGGAVIDPLLEDMIVEEARFAGMTRQELPAADAAEALVLGLINAAAKMMDKGLTAAEADLLCVRKLGFGGLSRLAAEWPVAEMLARLAPLDPTLWAPAKRLRKT